MGSVIIDGVSYNTVVIGDQEWTIENLRRTEYNDGSPIPVVEDNTEWTELKTGAMCWYDNVVDPVYGSFYNWHAVNTGKLAPTTGGWRVPSNNDFVTMSDYLIANGYNWDGSLVDNKIAKSLASKDGYTLVAGQNGAPSVNPELNNSTGFNSLPAGNRFFLNGSFISKGAHVSYWTSDEFDDINSPRVRIFAQYEYLSFGIQPKEWGLCVRLVRDIKSTVVIDGVTYGTVIIGDQEWMTENLRTTKYNDGTDIPLIDDNDDWLNLPYGQGARCWPREYTADEALRTWWGGLYNWFTLDKLAPLTGGWRVPDEADWLQLNDHMIASGYNYDGTTEGNKYAKALASSSGWWDSPTNGTIGNNQELNNSTGFGATPAGRKNGPIYVDKYPGYHWTPTDVNSLTPWMCWSSTETGTEYGWNRQLYYNQNYLLFWDKPYSEKMSGMSVRLVRDAEWPSESASESSSESASESASASFPPDEGYSRYNYESLPDGDSDLDHVFTIQEYSDVDVEDNIYVNQDSLAGRYMVFLFKDQFDSNTSPIRLHCRLKSSTPTSMSPAYLQIYNRTTGMWVTMAYNSTSNADQKFTLEKVVSTGLANYFDANNWVSCRVYQIGF